MKILHEDNHIIIVNKPFNLLTQGDATHDDSLFDQVKKYIKTKYRKPGNVYLGLVHRLDRPASGLIAFAKTSKAASRLSKQLRESKFTKRYLALVEDHVEVGETQTLLHYLKKLQTKNLVKISNTPKQDYKKATMIYKALDIHNKHISQHSSNFSLVINNLLKSTRKIYPNHTSFSLLEVNLITGRPHQIRAQLSYIGHPIIGDVKYGAASFLPDKNIGLIAYHLSFIHPTTRKILSFTL
ncbi:RluA family pseudouridine synthase [Patescibacteria group bacterium]|nr:RluA family pseudouridine synthase [Patescibacteria group bacterium]